MSRVKRGKRHLKHRHGILRLTKGYRWGRKSKIKLAKTAALKAGSYAYRDRRNLKRNQRQLWQIRINAALRERGQSYSKFMGQLKKSRIDLDRKILANLAANHPKIFDQVIAAAKQ